MCAVGSQGHTSLIHTTEPQHNRGPWAGGQKLLRTCLLCKTSCYHRQSIQNLLSPQHSLLRAAMRHTTRCRPRAAVVPRTHLRLLHGRHAAAHHSFALLAEFHQEVLIIWLKRPLQCTSLNHNPNVGVARQRMPLQVLSPNTFKLCQEDLHTHTQPHTRLTGCGIGTS